jgi:hypothetical protein
MDPDPDPAIFFIDLQDANKNYIKKISPYYFLKLHLHHISKIKKSKKSHETIRIKVSLYYFCLLIEGSGSGYIPLTSGSGSGRQKTCGSGGSGS